MGYGYGSRMMYGYGLDPMYFLVIIMVSILWFLSLFAWRSAALLMPFSIVVSSMEKVNFNYKKRRNFSGI